MITLSSDFGSPYPAAMKGVILSLTDARLVDVAHDFPRQDVRATAFWLREVLPYFPSAIHLVVVDPGVGTERKALLVRAGAHALVGPDNGVLLPAARALAGSEAGGQNTTNENDIEVFEWGVESPANHTFHGRDVFAPAAGAVHEAGIESVATLDRATPCAEYVDPTFPEPVVSKGKGAGESETVGEALVIDGFGNVITNLPGELLDGRYDTAIAVNGEPTPVRRTYAAVTPGERLVTVGSHARVELARNQGRGEEAFGLDVGDRVTLIW